MLLLFLDHGLHQATGGYKKVKLVLPVHKKKSLVSSHKLHFGKWLTAKTLGSYLNDRHPSGNVAFDVQHLLSLIRFAAIKHK